MSPTRSHHTAAIVEACLRARQVVGDGIDERVLAARREGVEGGDRRYEGAVARAKLQEALGFEHQESLAHRRAAHPELERHRFLLKELRLLALVAQEEVADVIVCPAFCRALVTSCGGAGR